jgi:monovalent cation/proton antiporter MnhG/PhaG subunit
MSVLQLIGSGLLLIGAFLSLLAPLGLLDFPTSLARMHAATKMTSLGLALIALGAGVAAESAGLFGIGVLVAVFLFLTAPISGHMLGRASYQAGQAPQLVHDDLATARPSSAIESTSPDSRPSLLRMIPLVLIWVLLWRDAGAGVWLVGIAVAALIEWTRRQRRTSARIKARGSLVFLGRYAWTVVLSTLRVAWEVVTPRNDQIREAIVAVSLHSNSMPVALLVANAISYTPGSLTIELTEDPLVLYVHVLHFESVAAVREEVAALERLVAAALGEEQPA